MKHRSLIPYQGGSHTVAGSLMLLLPRLREPIDLIETHCGSCEFSLQFPQHMIRKLTLNDVDEDLTNLLDVLAIKTTREAFLDALSWFPLSCEGLYNVLRALRNDREIWNLLDPIFRAVAYYIIMWWRFPSHWNSEDDPGVFVRPFRLRPEGETRQKLESFQTRPDIETVKKVIVGLDNAQVLKQDGLALLQEFANRLVLIFTDPPFPDSRKYKHVPDDIWQHIIGICHVVALAKAKCILKLPDHEEVRYLFEWMRFLSQNMIQLHELEPHKASFGTTTNFREVAITNYPVAVQVPLEQVT